MSANDVRLDLFLGGVWTSVPIMAGPVSITRGLDPFGSWPRPTRFEVDLDNDTLNYDPSNPSATIYGIAGRNTRARIAPDNAPRVWAEASSWTPERSIEHQPGARRGRSTTTLVAEGILRRLGRWTDPLRSPMYRTISARSTSIGHWSFEEPAGSTVVANSRGGGQAADVTGSYSLGDSDSPLGAASSLKLASTTLLAGEFVTASSTAGWQIAFSFKLAAVPSTSSYANVLRWRTTNGNTWQAQVNDTTYRFTVSDPDGSTLASIAVAFGTDGPTQWTTMRIKASVAAGTVTLEPAWYIEGALTEGGVTTTYAGTLGALRNWDINGANWMTDAVMSHVFGVTTVADNLVGATAQRVFMGYLGETAGARFLRLCTELGIARYMIGASADTMPMGPQRPDTILNLLADILATEDGRIDDERLDIALTMRTRRSLYAQTVALALTYPGHISPPFRRILDDEATANRVTVSNRAGGEVTVFQATGPLSVSAPPAGVGEYKKTVDVSVAYPGAQLPDIANWHLAKGTIERPRYDSVTVDLVANPSLKATAILVREGDLITVTGAEGSLVRLLVVGIQERISPGTWTITYQVEPGEPYDIGIWDDASFRWDARASTVNGAHTSTDVTIDLTTTDPESIWSTSFTGALDIEGETVTVTTMGAASGSNPYTQTATVVRSVNGVVKAQLNGARVHLADAKRWGL